MCKVYNSVGCLTAIKSHLQRHGVEGFYCLDDLIRFRQEYLFIQGKIIRDHTLSVGKKKEALGYEITWLEEDIASTKAAKEQHIRKQIKVIHQKMDCLPIPDSRIKRCIHYVKRNCLDMLIGFHELSIPLRLEYLVLSPKKTLAEKNRQYQDLSSHFADAVNKSALPQLQEHKRKKTIVDEINNYIYGAMAEQKVAVELEKLPEGYILINDFSLAFDPPLFNRSTRDYIKTVQIDHLVISPAGIFIIETKNWSRYSIENPYLFSPVQQVKRANYAMYRTITPNPGDSLLKHHWGNKKIPIRNIIVFLESKPEQEFEFVRILTLEELRRHITYFKPCLSDHDMFELADKLLRITHRTELEKGSWQYH